MSEKMFSREQYEQLRSFPEISRDELFRYFTLTPADVAFVDPGAGRGAADRLGMAVLVSALPWLGFVPDDVPSAPAAAVARLSERLGIPVGELRGYGAREQTRTAVQDAAYVSPMARLRHADGRRKRLLPGLDRKWTGRCQNGAF